MANRFTSAAALLVIGGLCGLALTQTYEITRAPVEQNRIRQAQALLSELLGREAPTDLMWQNDIANACGEWQFARGASVGYAGSIEYLALLQQDRIRLRITRHQETPGIADFVDHRKDPYLPPLAITSPADRSQLNTLSGATITHTALREMADQASTKLAYQREQTDCEATGE